MTELHTEQVDLVVIGGGPIGLATGWWAARRGYHVAVLDKIGFLNERCGSSGAERHWRLHYTESDLFQLTMAALPQWRQLEQLCDRQLIHEIGGLWFGDTKAKTNEGQIAATAVNMESMGVRYDWLTAPEIERRFGFSGLPRHFEGFFQPDAGTIDVRATLAGLYSLAQEAGCLLRSGETALGVDLDSDGVLVRTDWGAYAAPKLILACGGHINDLLEPLGARLDINLFEMALISMRIADTSLDKPFWFVFQEPTDDDTNLFYGFGRNPWSPSDLVRVGPNFEVDPLACADDSTGVPVNRHVQRTTSWITEHVPTIDPRPVGTGTCLAVLPSDPTRQFHLGLATDLLPYGHRVVICSSGWEFKFTPLFGRICAELALDEQTQYEISRLAPAGRRSAAPRR